jgi:hypothetical protein
MQVRCELQFPVALNLEKETTVIIGYEIGWTPEIIWTLLGRENFLSLESSVFHPVAH